MDLSMARQAAAPHSVPEHKDCDQAMSGQVNPAQLL